MYTRPSKQTAGFTLVELIVVMVIIGLLSAAFIVNTGSKDDLEHQAEIQTALISLGQAQEAYASRNNSYFGTSGNTEATKSSIGAWTGFSIEAGDDIKVTIDHASSNTYCAEAYHTSAPDGIYSLVPGERVIFKDCDER